MIVIALIATLAGSTPPGLTAPSRIAYVTANASDSSTCRLEESDRWSCSFPTDPSPGLVVIVGERAIAFRPVTPDAEFAIKTWGRLVVIQPGSIADSDLAVATLTGWTPARSRFRPHATRFVAVPEPSFDIRGLAPGVFWIAANDADPDAFVLLGGGRCATARAPISALKSGDVSVPFFVVPPLCSSLVGRVQDGQGGDVDATDVELFERLESPADGPDLTAGQLLAAPLVRIGVTRTGPDGAFTFDHVGQGPFVLQVTDASRGRGHAIAWSAGESTLIRLAGPARAIGRVLRGHLPAPGVRVRLIPDPQALAAATDVRDLAAPELTTAADGRFTILLPPVLSGAFQFSAPDGSSARISVPARSGSADLNLGDVELAAPQVVLIRLAGGDGCVLSAIGPLGAAGVSIVKESGSLGINRRLELPEAGDWMLVVDCGSRPASVVPDVFTAGQAGSAPVVEARVGARR